MRKLTTALLLLPVVSLAACSSESKTTAGSATPTTTAASTDSAPATSSDASGSETTASGSTSDGAAGAIPGQIPGASEVSGALGSASSAADAATSGSAEDVDAVLSVLDELDTALADKDYEAACNLTATVKADSATMSLCQERFKAEVQNGWTKHEYQAADLKVIGDSATATNAKGTYTLVRKDGEWQIV